MIHDLYKLIDLQQRSALWNAHHSGLVPFKLRKHFWIHVELWWRHGFGFPWRHVFRRSGRKCP